MRLRWIAAAIALIAGVSVEAQESDEGLQRTFRLAYRPNGITLSLQTGFDDREIVFVKEPEFKGRRVHRGVLSLDPDTKQAVGFAWDVKANNLYIDLNGNRDLTDDPKGTFHNSGNPGRFRAPIAFNLPFQTGQLPYHLDLGLSPYQGRLVVSPRMHSGWVGSIELNGTSWEMAVADNMDGRIGVGDGLFLRPQSDDPSSAMRPFDPSEDQLCELPIAHHLFLSGVYYDLAFAFEHGGDAPSLDVTFTERTDRPTGELLITGSSIRRLTLETPENEGEPTVVVLDHPGPRVVVPTGLFAKAVVYLDPGDAWRPYPAWLQTAVAIEEGGQTTLTVGAPLRHEVSVQANWGELAVATRLVGVGGEPYQPYGSSSDLPPPPVVSVLHNGHQVATGAMRYG
jgi:hypothetical protein